jgi:hypothetical protein
MTPSDSGVLPPVPLPSRLPHPLDDPLRFYRRLFSILLVPMFLALSFGLLLPRVGGPLRFERLSSAESIVTFVLGLAVWRLLPRRTTSVIYLRSFRNDPVAYPIRTVIAGVLGPGFRLSGIRDPRRRWPWLVRHLLYLPFLLRYCRPRFMNLEAGADWKARLWRSLGEARCAVIDLTDLTPFVLDEVQLALRCLGPERVLFVVDASLSQREWEEQIVSRLAFPVSTHAVRLAVWENTPPGRRAFANQVRHFADRVPESPAGLKPDAWPLTQSDQLIQGRSGGRARALVEFGLANVVSLGLLLFLGLLCVATPPSLQRLWFVPSVGLLLLNGVFLLQYLLESGSARDWGWSFLILGPGGLLASALLFAEWQNPVEVEGMGGVRGAALRVRCTNNLQQIGLAVRTYDADKVRLPPAPGHMPEGQGLESWGAVLLPYIEQEGVFKDFQPAQAWAGPYYLGQGETWNGSHNFGQPEGIALADGSTQTILVEEPHNAGRLEGWPKVYLAPFDLTPAAPPPTYYLVLVGRGAPLWREAPRPDEPFRRMPFAFGETGITPAGASYSRAVLDW